LLTQGNIVTCFFMQQGKTTILLLLCDSPLPKGDVLVIFYKTCMYVYILKL